MVDSGAVKRKHNIVHNQTEWAIVMLFMFVFVLKLGRRHLNPVNTSSTLKLSYGPVAFVWHSQFLSKLERHKYLRFQDLCFCKNIIQSLYIGKEGSLHCLRIIC